MTFSVGKVTIITSQVRPSVNCNEYTKKFKHEGASQDQINTYVRCIQEVKQQEIQPQLDKESIHGAFTIVMVIIFVIMALVAIVAYTNNGKFIKND